MHILKEWLKTIGIIIVCIVIGLAGGLLYGLVIDDVEYMDVDPEDLALAYKEDYVSLIAADYAQTLDLPIAQQRIRRLGFTEESVGKRAEQALLAQEAGARALARLATDLGFGNERMTAALMTPSSTPTLSPSSTVSPTQKARPSGTSTPTQKARPSGTSTPTQKARPSRTSTPTQKARPSRTSTPTQKARPSRTSTPTQKARPSRTSTPTQKARPSRTSTPTQKARPSMTATTATTATETPQLPTETPRATATETPRATATETRQAPTQTPLSPTLTPLPPTATVPPVTPTPVFDFVVSTVRMLSIEENGGCEGFNNAYVTVFDGEGNSLNGVTVALRGDSGEEIQQTGHLPTLLGQVNFELDGSYQALILNDANGNPVRSQLSRLITNQQPSITDLIVAGYCFDQADCQARQSQLCEGHYSWEIVFQQTY